MLLSSSSKFLHKIFERAVKTHTNSYRRSRRMSLTESKEDPFTFKQSGRSLSTMSKGSLLRGASDDSLASSVMRYITEATIEQSPPPTSNNDDESFLVVDTIMAIAIALCCVYCMFAVVRHFCCRRRDDEVHPSGSILVDQGVVFSLNPAERRAVLEVIFSEMSKVRWSGSYSSML